MVEDILDFFRESDFAVAGTLNGAEIIGIPNGGTIEPVSGMLISHETSWVGPAFQVGAAVDGDALVIASGPFAGSYMVRSAPELSVDRTIATLKLERQ